MSYSKSPLRYPGGKQRLSPFLIELLQANELLGGYYSEPYAGGAGAAIFLLLGNHVRHIHLNDSSYPIYAFWNSILNNTEAFCQLISSANLTIGEWRRQREILKSPDTHGEIEVGYSAFYLNRCNRSGVLSGGVIGGLSQEGEWKMDARFSKKELIKRIQAIAAQAHRVTISNLDAEQYLEQGLATMPNDAILYFDPPYYQKSSGLYLDKYQKGDHQRISETIQNIRNVRWLLSYDAADQILELYRERTHFTYSLQYNASTVYKGKEVFIFCDEINLPTSSSLSFIQAALNTLPTAEF